MTNQETPEAKDQEPQKQPYEPPKATFVPLKLQERILGCSQYYMSCYSSQYQAVGS
jgi:hypothetical protein